MLKPYSRAMNEQPILGCTGPISGLPSSRAYDIHRCSPPSLTFDSVTADFYGSIIIVEESDSP